MKKNMKTALTAAVFAAAVGVSTGSVLPAEAAYLAATDQRTMQILYGPAPNTGPDEIGDINYDKVLNAKDLTLMKRTLLIKSPDELSALNERYNFYREDSLRNASDARALMQYLTGMEADSMYPVEFKVYFKPVPYLSDSVPETDAERHALTKAAKARLNWLADTTFRAQGKDPQNPVYLHRLVDVWWDGIELNEVHVIGLTDGFAPNDTDPDDRPVHKSVLLAEVMYEDYSQCDPDETDEDDLLIPAVSISKLEIPITTALYDPQRGGLYYDKCLVEWDVNTDKTLVHESLTPSQQAPE